MNLLKVSTAATVAIGPVLDSAGAAYTGIVIGDLNITKNGTTAAMASAASVTHSHNGIYLLTFTTGNTDTLGRLEISCNKSTYAMSVFRYSVLSANVFDSLIPATDILDVSVTQLLGTAWLTPAVAGTPDVNTKTITAGAITAASIATDAIDADALAADALVEIQAACNSALVGQNLDHLVKIAVDTDLPTTVHLNSVIGYMIDNGTSATYDRTTDSLEVFGTNAGVAPFTIVVSMVTPSGELISQPIRVAQYESKTLSFTLQDQNGNAINDNGDSFKLIVYKSDKKTPLFEESGTASTSTVAITIDDAHTTLIGSYYYRLWNVTEDTVRAENTLEIYKGPQPALVSGTVASSTGTTTTLDTGATNTNDLYNDMRLVITSGPGFGQSRIISDYNLGRICTHEAWATNPTSASTWAIYEY